MNVLASSIVLVCRPRTSEAGNTTRREFLAALKKELAPALRQLQKGNIAPVDYVWTNFRPGTYIYQSGTHPAVQVQMGLYGGITKDFNVAQAYQGIDYIKQVPVFFSEIDPALHQAVSSNNYGPGKAMTSTIDYDPKYFLINGQAYSESSTPIFAGRSNQKILLRFFNIGLETRSPLLQGLYMKNVAEDGNPYKYPKESYTLPLTAAKTLDAVITSPAIGKFPLYDRRLALTNAGQSHGGMLIYLDITYNPDFNNDQFVNLLDYAILAAEWGRTDCSPANPCQANLNTDGQVDLADLILWAEWWQQIP